MRGDVRRDHFAKKRDHLESFFVKQFVHAAHFSGGRAGGQLARSSCEAVIESFIASRFCL